MKTTAERKLAHALIRNPKNSFCKYVFSYFDGF